MRTSWHHLWGSAQGPLTRLAPQTRLLAGTGTFAACMITPAGGLEGSVVISALTSAWLAACRPPLQVVRAALLLGLALLLPPFLLVPVMAASSIPGGGGQAAAVAWSILIHGLSGMLISISTVVCLTASDLREGLARLPVPGIVAAILLQIVHQTATLSYETKRIGSAMAVRGASGGVGTAWRVLASLPRVWLPRIMVRAERVASAMELRGYCDAELQSFRQVETGLADVAALVLVAGALAVAVAARVWGVP
jgi:energy-coupling factor transporter transmembrane protein EcfT